MIFAYVFAKKNKSATSKKANIKKYSISIEGKITKSSAAGEKFWMFYYKNNQTTDIFVNNYKIFPPNSKSGLVFANQFA